MIDKNFIDNNVNSMILVLLKEHFFFNDSLSGDEFNKLRVKAHKEILKIIKDVNK